MLRPFCGSCALAAGLAVLLSGAAHAQANSPVMTLVARRVIDRYQNSTCEQLWARRGEKPGSQEQRVLDLLNDDPQLRQGFFDQIAAPVMNKMFSCGMIP